MKQKEQYGFKEKNDLIDKYRIQAYMSTGSTDAKEWYLLGVEYAKKECRKICLSRSE